MAEVAANGIKLHVQRLSRQANLATPARLAGPAPSVVFLHGLFIDNLSSLYYSLANPVAAAGADAILYDLRGHGRSEQPARGYTLDDSVTDLLALVDALGVGGPVHLVGHSYGASVALRAALTHPDRLASLVLIEPHCAASDDGGSWVEDVADTLTATALSFEHAWIPDDLPASAQRRLRTFRGTHAFLNATSLIEDVAAAPPFTDEQLQALSVPTLALYGEHTDLAASMRLLATSAPACRMEVLPGLGHSVLRDATATVLELVLAWLEETGAGCWLEEAG